MTFCYVMPLALQSESQDAGGINQWQHCIP